MRPSSSAVRLAGRHPLGLDHAGPPLGDQAEAGEQGAEDPELHQQAGHEERVRVGGAELAGERLEQRAEQREVEDRLQQPDDHPGRVAQRDAAAGGGRRRRSSRANVRDGAPRGLASGGILVAERAAGQGEEHVVEGGAAHLDRASSAMPGRVQRRAAAAAARARRSARAGRPWPPRRPRDAPRPADPRERGGAARPLGGIVTISSTRSPADLPLERVRGVAGHDLRRGR